jgi:hypothetical protein
MRKMVHDLLSPMIEKMNHERGKLNQFNERANFLDNRLNTLEHIHGIKEKRPKIFEEIYNQFAESKEYVATVEARFDQRVDEVHGLFSKQQTAIDQVDRIANTLNAKADNLDALSKDMR